MTLAITVGLLVAGAVYLFTKREMLRVILGFVLLGHAGNLVLMAAGGTDRRHEPFGTVDPNIAADPLPQAFVLTAIVIAFSITVFMLVLAVTGDDGDRTTGRTETLNPDEEAASDQILPTTTAHPVIDESVPPEMREDSSEPTTAELPASAHAQQTQSGGGERA